MREAEQKLQDEPVGLVSFNVKNHSEVRLAIAAGTDVYIFIGLKPHYKATIPLEEIHDEDAAVWSVLNLRHLSMCIMPFHRTVTPQQAA